MAILNLEEEITLEEEQERALQEQMDIGKSSQGTTDRFGLVCRPTVSNLVTRSSMITRTKVALPNSGLNGRWILVSYGFHFACKNF